MAYIAGAATDAGRRRSKNEDSILAPIFLPELCGRNGEPGAVLAVADGVGGAVGGAIASSTAIEAFRAAVMADSLSDPAARLIQAFQRANQAVRASIQANPSLRGMGTTMVAALALDQRIWLANLGDSRGYLIQSAEMSQVSRDHSLVAEAVRAGMLTPEDVEHRPERHVITRSLGQSDTLSVDSFGPLRFSAGDVVFLCSDGLHDVVHDDQMLAVFSTFPPAEAVQELVRLANEAGGPDNISVVALASA